MGLLEVRVVVEYAAGVGVGRSEAALGTGEVVAEATAGVGVGILPNLPLLLTISYWKSNEVHLLRMY